MITFRTANLNDLPIINKLVNSAYRGEYAKQGWTTEADLIDGQRTDEEALKEFLSLENQEILLAFENDSLVGCAQLTFESDKTLYFGMLTVDPTLQSKGLGKLIMAEIDRIALQRGRQEIRISVIPLRHELIAFYQRRGFVATGNWEEFPSDPRNGKPKVDGLRLDEYIKKLI